MVNLDSLTLKYFFEENRSFVLGAIVQKIQQPSRREIILTIRNLELSQNKKLYINIDPKYPHICFINEKSAQLRNINIPQKPPMFCMQLRKYLNGSKIKDFKYIEYDRILEFYFDYFNEIGSLTRICLSVEFMGKYSNIIIYNVSNKEIIGVAHNVSSEKSSIRELYGGIKYIYPPLKEKLDILKVSYSTFYEIAKSYNIKEISDNFYYLNRALLKYIFKERGNIENIFNFLQNLVSMKEYSYICNLWGGDSVSNAIDNYFSNEIFQETIKTNKNKLIRILNNYIEKTQKSISLYSDFSREHWKSFKDKADLIMSNLYTVENLTFELPQEKTPLEYAQEYYKMYKDCLKTYEHRKKRLEEYKQRLEYYESILFNIENSNSYSQLDEIKAELIDIGLIKEKKAVLKPVLESVEFQGFTIYIGKNNKQNDFLISKIANGEDLWFHGLNYPSAHVILKIPNGTIAPPREVLEFCAKLTKENSKAKDGGKASIIMTKRKNLKKPPNTYLGYVTYKDEIEIVI